MLKIYGILTNSEFEWEYVAFYLKKSDADADVKDREQECVVEPIVIREEYPSVHKED